MRTYSLTSLGLKDIFVAKYDPQGRPLWAFSIGGIDGGPGIDDEGVSIAVYFTGFFRETATLSSDNGGADAVVSAGEEDGYLISMDQNADLNWIFRYGDIPRSTNILAAHGLW